MKQSIGKWHSRNENAYILDEHKCTGDIIWENLGLI
jgi:hypothetical protein